MDKAIIEELQAIKKLLVLFLIKAGTSGEEIALAIGGDKTKVSKLLPARKIKKFDQ